MTDREWLRLHLEAVWNISLPALEGASVELLPSDALPPWSLYQAQFTQGAQDAVTLWRPDAAPQRRAELLERARRAGVVFDPALGMRREVVLRLRADAPRPATHALPHAVARMLGADDVLLLEAFEAESAAYFLSSEHAPCIGVIVDGWLASVAHSSRRTALACELGINTAPEARRQRYATAATIAWTEAILQEGVLPIYSAFAHNTASLRLAAAAGYTPVIEGVYGPISAVET